MQNPPIPIFVNNIDESSRLTPRNLPLSPLGSDTWLSVDLLDEAARRRNLSANSLAAKAVVQLLLDSVFSGPLTTLIRSRQDQSSEGPQQFLRN
jgi:hypothetical protein